MEREIMKRKFQAAFTLIELMIVIAIIGILAGMAVPSFQKARKEAKQKKCWEFTSILTRLCEQYNIDNRAYPNVPEDLTTYLANNKFPQCPSGNPYVWRDPPNESTGAVVKCPEHIYASASIGQ